MEDITKFHYSKICDLLRRFALKAYSSKLHDEEDEKIIDICIELWKLDYKCEILENKNGILCSTYPSRIIIPTHELGAGGSIAYSSPLSRAVTKAIASESKNQDALIMEKDERDKVEHYLDVAFLPAPSFSSIVKLPSKQDEETKKLEGNGKGGSSHKFNFKEYLNIANRARCRYRFPVPAILCKGKYISRSATLSCLIDVLGKKIFHSIDSSPDTEDEIKPRHSNDLDKARFYDIKLLEAIGTTSIMDLMVENKKIKYTVPVSSSEKADRENRYYRFNINSIPYPGCEFFSEFSDQNFSSSNLHYNWDSHVNDTKLSLAEEKISSKVTSEWSNYKEWDLRTMTENYLKLIQRYIIDEESEETGFLVHCISGWDRTPLFISLLRLSLWADGLVHCNLNSKQMLFFTLAYDWYLFGHQLPERLKSNESILYFCFEFLDVIDNESFTDSGVNKRERHPSNGSTAYDSATDGIDTPLSSFGSTTSLASSSSNPPSSTHSGPNIKVSPSKQQQQQQQQQQMTSSTESSVWPFNKENGFTFEGISDNESSSQGLISESDTGANVGSFSSKVSSRSPLKERNKGSPKSVSSPSCKLSIGTGGRKNLNGVLRDITGKRTRKASTTESPSVAMKGPGGENGDGGVSEVDSASCTILGQEASDPVPVPGVRSRHNSSSSSMGSWQMLSTSDAFNESLSSFSSEIHKSSRTSLTADMADSTNTIKEEVSPSSSLDSSHSIIVFDRKRRLTEIREMFVKIYKKEVSSLHSESSFLSGIVNNFYNKLGT